jgi:spermidine/putrescine transport system permease protein
MLAFTLSLDDFIVSFFTGGAGSTTLPVLIYSSVKRGVSPEINALSTLLILASTLATIVVTFIQKSPTIPLEDEKNPAAVPVRNFN